MLSQRCLCAVVALFLVLIPDAYSYEGHFWSVDRSGEALPKEYKLQGPAYAILSPNLSERTLPTGATDLVRFFNQAAGRHFWTINPEEMLGQSGWQREGTVGYVFREQAKGTVPLYRWDHPEHGHFWSTEKSEEANLPGWRYNAVACFVYPKDHTSSNTLTMYRFFTPVPPSSAIDCKVKGFTGCGAVCTVSAPVHYAQLVLLFKAMKKAGVSECRARAISMSGTALAAAVAEYEFGELAGVVASLVGQACGPCAVDEAY